MRRRSLISLMASALVLGACATATPYQPAGNNQRGFIDQKIESNRWQVSFSGNSLTERRTVETYLLYRAAELTDENGFDHFRVVQRDTDENSMIVPTGFSRSPFYSGFYCDYRFFGAYGPFHGTRFGPSAFHRPGFGFRNAAFHDPFGYGFGPADYREIVRYEARAEIIMGKGDKPEDDPAYFTADDVLENLASSIERPEA